MIKHLSRISFELDINRQVQLVLYCTSIKTNHEMQLKATEKQLNPELGLFIYYCLAVNVVQTSSVICPTCISR